jgi:GNAT superfamily N-acetyltransferase
MSASVEFRPVSEHDAEEIARIDQALTQLWRVEHWEDRIAFAMRRDPEGSRVATCDGKVVAYLFSDVRGQEYGFDETTGWVEALGVSPSQQGSSLGRSLVEQVLERFEKTGVHTVRTLVSEQHSAMGSFLGHLGFQEEPVKVMTRKLGQ